MKKLAIVAGALLVVALAAWLAFFRPSDEDQIRKTLDRFARALEVKRDDTVLSRGGRVKSQLKELVTDDVHVDVPDLNVRVTGRGSLAENATAAGLAFTSADASFTSLTIKLDDAHTTAKVDGTVVVRGDRNGDQRVDKRSVHLLLRRDDGWKITTVDVAGPE
ncbi:MAG: hypothetical protein JWP97_3047 [Labilithrix sp.]|nr:hypothetical protein [Labilithrix sp.]